MSDLRSSKQQLQDELRQAYDEMTDPEMIARRRNKEEREERIKEKAEDYGL
jgi:hypothetical protein